MFPGARAEFSRARVLSFPGAPAGLPVVGPRAAATLLDLSPAPLAVEAPAARRARWRGGAAPAGRGQSRRQARSQPLQGKLAVARLAPRVRGPRRHARPEPRG